VGQAGITTDRSGAGSARFSVTVDETKWHAGRVELPPDAMPADDTWHFVIPRAERVEVLVVGHPERDTDGDARYIQRALDPTGEGEKFACSFAEASSLERQDRRRFRVVVLADVERIDRGGVEWVRQHLSSGGGVLICLGNRTDIRFWNSELLPELVGAELRRPVERSEGVRLAPAGPGHPILEGLVFGERLIDDIYVRRAFEMGTVEAEEVLELPGIGPALFFTEGSVGGEVACLTTGVDPSWNDLPRSGFIVPLLHRVADRLARAGSPPTAVLVGEDLRVDLPAGFSDRVEVNGPENSVMTAEMIFSGVTAAAVREATMPGIYSFQSGDHVVALRAVNLDPSESDLERASRDVLENSIAPLPSVFVEPDADAANVVLQARHGRELWRLFLYAALLLVALEMVVARPRYA
jgi:hypothetical protein